MSSVPTFPVSGSVVVLFADGGAADRYLKIDLSSGSIKEIGLNNQGHLLVGDCTGAALLSPNAAFVAKCLNQSIGIFTKADGELKVSCPVNGLVINGYVWDSHSRLVGILAHSVRVSLAPQYWLHALSGHPMQFESYSIIVCNTTNGRSRVLNNLFAGHYSFAQIKGWING
jgi:hypothetical protein